MSAVSADVNATGVTGVQHLNAVSGDMSTELFGADLELKTVSGDVKVKGHGQPAKLRVTSVSGDVHLEHGAGELETSTVSGTLVVSLDSASSVRVRTTSGDLRFEGKLTRDATLEATTVSGDMNVRAAAAGGFAYEITTFSRRHRQLLRRQGAEGERVRAGLEAHRHARRGRRPRAHQDHERGRVALRP